MNRADLSAALHECTTNVYFQRPPNTMMKYPCILYQKEKTLNIRADNGIYVYRDVYKITIIDSNPDSQIPRSVCERLNCDINTIYAADNMYHHVINAFVA
jgi:hypothetical protein